MSEIRPVHQRNKIRARIAVLRRELAAIHHTNAVYWQKQTRSAEGKADFQRRITRLQEIQEELERLTEADPSFH